MSYSALQRLTDKKGDKLSKILGIDSGPSTKLIADMQARINNPLFKLSIADYEAMCGNKMMLKLMSKVIGCKEKQLKKFCKYINVFAENINLSPKSIKNEMNVKKNINASMRRGSLHILPDDILEKIVNKYKTIFKLKYVLKDWVPLENLDWGMLSANPNAIELLKANEHNIKWLMFLENINPKAIELIKENRDTLLINWNSLSRNPAAIELLKENPNDINWKMLSSNPAAIELLKANPNDINWNMLSSNPAAIELLKANPDNIDWKMLSSNPAAIELLQDNKDKIIWYMLSKNINPKAIDMLKANPKKINWQFLSENPAAIELLKENKTMIFWKNLSINPAIFDEILE